MNKFELKEILERDVVTVVFEKVDGSIREMKCTLLTEYIPAPKQELLSENVFIRKEPEGVISVWDVDSNGWRSFRLDSVKEIRT